MRGSVEVEETPRSGTFSRSDRNHRCSVYGADVCPCALEEGNVVQKELSDDLASCPDCAAELEALRVARLLRTRGDFTSTLPRRGHVISCLECTTIIAAELVGFA